MIEITPKHARVSNDDGSFVSLIQLENGALALGITDNSSSRYHEIYLRPKEQDDLMHFLMKMSQGPRAKILRKQAYLRKLKRDIKREKQNRKPFDQRVDGLKEECQQVQADIDAMIKKVEGTSK